MGEIDASNKRIKGVIIEAVGDVKQNGIIRTAEDAFVGIKTLGKYESNTGEIIQGEKNKKRIDWGKWQTILALIAIILPILGWLFFGQK